MATLTVNMEGFPADTEWYIVGLEVLFPQGQAVDVPQEQVDAFEATTGVPLAEAVADCEYLDMSGVAAPPPAPPPEEPPPEGSG